MTHPARLLSIFVLVIIAAFGAFQGAAQQVPEPAAEAQVPVGQADAGTGPLGNGGFEGKRIEDVKFEGLITSDPFSVKSVVDTKSRSLFSQDAIDRDIKALYKLELFDNIQVDVEGKDQGVTVTFIFTELPSIKKVEIRGNNKLKDSSIKQKILLKEGSVFKEPDVYADMQSIVKFYEEKGYPNTSVEYEVVEKKEKDKKTGTVKNTVDLVFTVNESGKLVINSVNFSGTEMVKPQKLQQLIKTRPKGYWLSSGHFKEDQFELDKIAIIKYYGEKGYIDAAIVKVDKETKSNEGKKRNEMDLTLYIQEGPQYKYGGVRISGNEIFTEAELYPLIKSKQGEVFNRTEFEKGVQAVRDIFSSNGYIYYSFGMEENKNQDTLVVSYSITVKENSKAHVEKIFITGNEKTKRYVIERELEIVTGDIFNSKNIQRSIEKLYNLQYFATVNLDVKPGTELGLVDLIFDVEEQRTGLFTFGLSYSTSGWGFAVFEEVSANNFRGRGLRLHEKLELGFNNQSFEVGIDEPWFLGTPTSAGFTLSYGRILYGKKSGDDIYVYDPLNLDHNGLPIPAGVVEIDNGDGTYTLDYANADSMEYTNQAFRAALRLGRRFGRYYGLSGEVAFSVFQNAFVSGTLPYDEGLREQFAAGGGAFMKNSLSLTGYRDTRDFAFFATRGTFVSQSITFYGGPFGGYSDFLKLNTDMNINVKTFWKFVFSARLNFGFIFPWLGLPLKIDEGDFIRVDCLNEGRGWQRPSQYGSLSSYNARAELNMSFENRFPIAPRIAWGLAFFDVSGAYDSPEEFAVDPRDLYYSFGVGLSFMVPGLPIRLYLARRFKYDETLGQYQFTNSQNFFRDWDFVFAVAGFF
jgi:outer membrane protein insertion porin family